MAVVAAPTVTALSPQVGAQPIPVSLPNIVRPIFLPLPTDPAPTLYPIVSPKTYGYSG